MHHIALVFLAIALILVVARLLGRLAITVGQPPVVGEIAAGIAMGPSLLGLLPGELDTRLFSPEVLPHLNTLAQLGLVLFMFIVGLELDMALIRGRERTAGTISIASVLVPFALAIGLALVLHGRHDAVDGEPVTMVALMLFLGVAMSITAFPVLARILTDRRMHRTPTGVLALACAAIDDIIAWTLLAFVVAVVNGDGPTEVIRIVLLTALFAGIMFGLVRPVLARIVGWHRRAGRLTPDILAIVLVGVLLSAFVTDWIGIHAIFGAFVFGAVMPRNDAAELIREILERLEQVSVLLLLPLFFVITGLQTDVSGIGLSGLWELGLILLVAVGGKWVGAYVAGRGMRLPSRQASAIGVLMNTRGLTELVILQIGRQLGVLDDTLFTLLVLMALITTAMTGPLLARVYPDGLVQRDIAAAERAALGLQDAYRVVVVLDDKAGEHQMRAVAERLLGGRRPGQLVLTRLIERPTSRLELGSGIAPDLALMANEIEALNALAADARAQGIAVSAVCRFTADPWTDVVEVARTADAAVLLVERGWFDAVGAALPAALEPFTLAVVERLGNQEAAEGDVAVLADDGANGRAAALLGAGWARAGGHGLVLVASGRPGAKLVGALRRLSEAGSIVRSAESVGALDTSRLAVVLSAGLSAEYPDEPGSRQITRVAVVAGQESADAELSEAIRTLVEPGSPTTR